MLCNDKQYGDHKDGARRPAWLAGLALLALWTSAAADAAEPRLVFERDSERDGGIFASQVVAAGEYVYFSASTSEHGEEIWGTDGTAAGTFLAADLCPGPCRGHRGGQEPASMVEFQGDLYVLADDEIRGLWRFDGPGERPARVSSAAGSPIPLEQRLVFLGPNGFQLEGKPYGTDGTPEGTQLIAPSGRRLTRAGNRVFFLSGASLWVTDGTPEGSREVRSFVNSIERLFAFGDRILFEIADSRLWVSDGTSLGTEQLLHLEGRVLRIDDGAVAGEQAFFTVRDFDLNRELWRTDGTVAGTRPVVSFVEGCFNSCPMVDSIAAGGKLFFGTNTIPDDSLWVSDGTEQGTRRLAGLGSTDVRTLDKVATDHRFFFVLDSPDGAGQELWASDGNEDGTYVLRTFAGNVADLVADGDRMFFTVRDSGRQQLWRSDGTVGGTVTLEDRDADTFQIRDVWGVFWGRLFFTASDAIHLSQPWISDGTPGSSRLVTVVDDHPLGLKPQELTATSRFLMFSGVADEFGTRRLWRSDGTGSGTSEVGAPEIRYPGLVAVLGDDLLVENGSRLWRTDGTAGETELVYQRDQDFRIAETAVIDGIFYFLDRGDDLQLWRSDATPDGTFPIVEIPTGFSLPYGLLTAEDSSGNRRLVFLAGDGSGRLWSSDGTFDGTRLIPLPGRARRLLQLDPWVYFDVEGLPRQLWRSDGTEAGTTPVIDDSTIFPGGAFIWMAGETLLYAVVAVLDDGSLRNELWSSDGSAAGSRRIADLPSLPVQDFRDFHPFLPTTYLPIGDTLYFAVEEAGYGVELWRAEPTSAGRVSDIWPGPIGSFPQRARVAGGRLYFAASDGLTGLEPWVIDGTTADPVQLADLAAGSLSSNPSGFAAFGDEIFFQADDHLRGPELWAVSRAAGCRVTEQQACLSGGRFQVSVRWRNQHAGGTEGIGHPAPFSDDSARFWFFDADNIELVVKILDGRGLNGHFWFFSGALSDVEYWIDVTDRVTGETRTFHNPAGNLCGISDIEALPAGDSAGPPDLPAAAETVPQVAAKAGSCGGGETALCLREDRFRVEVRWKNQHAGGVEGDGRPIPGTDESGYFWFFDSDSVELIVKVLDGRSINGKFWVFFGALSDVEYWVTVTESETGAEKTYHNPPGELCGVSDITAF